MLKESISMSWENIKCNKLRSFLTILGIIIGVCAIIALVTLMTTVIDEVNRKFDSIGANTVVVQAYGTNLKSGLNERDLAELRALEGVSGLSPSASTVADIYQNGKIFEKITLDGKNEVYFRRNKDVLKEGRAINILDIENHNRVCVINREMQKKLFPGERALGKTLLIGGVSYQIIGIIDTTDELESVMTAMTGQKDTIILPYTNVMRMADMKNVTALEIYLEDSENTDAVVDQIKKRLDEAFNYKDDSYTVIEMENLLDMMRTMQNMLQTTLIGIACISLLVGGIGIMNMMLVSVTERTTEIGLRKALGAEPRRIQIQFLVEAILLSLLGGIVGTILGILISFVCTKIIGIAFAISWSAIALGVGFSAAVGIIFGYTPARKASQLNPIDALRSI